MMIIFIYKYKCTYRNFLESDLAGAIAWQDRNGVYLVQTCDFHELVMFVHPAQNNN